MSAKYLTGFAAFAICTSLSACATTSGNTSSIAKIDRKKTDTITVQNANYVSTTSPNYVSNSQAGLVCDNERMRVRAADSDAENDSARIIVLDDVNDKSSNIIGETLVNCRDYFARNKTSLVPASVGGSSQAPNQYNSGQYNTGQYTTGQYSADQSNTANQYNRFSTPSQGATPAPAAQSTSTIVRSAPIQAHTAPVTASYSSSVTSYDTGASHRVRSGDTLYSIARNNCTSVDAIKRLNGINNPRTLDVDTVLRMPAGSCR